MQPYIRLYGNAALYFTDALEIIYAQFPETFFRNNVPLIDAIPVRDTVIGKHHLTPCFANYSRHFRGDAVSRRLKQNEQNATVS